MNFTTDELRQLGVTPEAIELQINQLEQAIEQLKAKQDLWRQRHNELLAGSPMPVTVE